MNRKGPWEGYRRQAHRRETSGYEAGPTFIRPDFHSDLWRIELICIWLRPRAVHVMEARDKIINSREKIVKNDR